MDISVGNFAKDTEKVIARNQVSIYSVLEYSSNFLRIKLKKQLS